jgi:esterase/lipase superfamily enzyme
MHSSDLRLFSSPAESSKALVFIDGWLSANKERCDDLLSALSDVGWQHSVYQFWWDASSFESAMATNYHKCKSRAKYAGRNDLQRLIESQIREKNICIIAHSLGARVAYEGMINWTANHHVLEDVILLSGAVRRDSSKDWGCAVNRIKGNLINIYNEDDPRLKKWFRLAEAGNACGRKPIKEYHPRIKNEDATYFLGKTHNLSRPLSYLKELVNKGIWYP